MFVNTKRTIKITYDNGTVFAAKAGWIGEVPNWVQDHWYFKALCKDGTVTAIVSSKVQGVTEPLKIDDDGDSALTALRARAAELKIPRSTQLGKDKLIAAISEAEAKLKPPVNPPDLLASMDVAALRQFAESNNIDLSGVAEDASSDDIRAAIEVASDGEKK